MSDEITRDEVEALKARVRRLESKLEQDDEQHPEGIGHVSPGTLDSYDKAVLNVLELGEDYSASTLIRKYKSRTKIRNDKTAKKRLKALVKQNVLERTGPARYECRREK